MAIKNPSFWSLTIILTVLLSLFNISSSTFQIPTCFVTGVSGGNWVLLHASVGISVMHMQVLHNNKIIMFDRTDFGPSNLSLPEGKCRDDQNDSVLKKDCTAHSLLYDIATNTYRPLMVQTDTWCSSGSVIADGTLVQTGGYNDGERVVRTFSPCDDDNCDWKELLQYLSVRRWYASNQILPDGRVIVVGGRNVFSYEFFPKNSVNISSPANYYMNFLKETRDIKDENNLYPFLHLLPDGNLFVFANKRSILLDYKNNRVIKEFPVIPGEKRNYPSTGSSTLLPLRLTGGEAGQLPEPEIMVCGGAPAGSYLKAEKRVYVTASKTCGRIKLTDPEPKWVMEKMPMPRVISDMLLLPTGDIILINGASKGSAGWEDGNNPVLNPVLYRTYEPSPDKRFTVLNPSKIPRMYHSAATLLPDGRIIVGGSNPHKSYDFETSFFPTELSLEAFWPHYLAPQYAPMRPAILAIEIEGNTVSYGQQFSINFVLSFYRPDLGVSVTMVPPSFTTHSFAMNQRLLVLNVEEIIQSSMFAYKVVVRAPTTANIAPSGYYMLFVVHAGIPSVGGWVKVR